MNFSQFPAKLLICFLACLGLWCQSGTVRAADTTTTYTISGHAYSYTSEGAPVGIADVTVAITGTSLSTTTTSTGAYSFTGLAAGTYTLTATKTGDVFTASGSPVTLPTTGTTAPNGVVNFSTYLIFGTVTVNGTPASGVTVNLGGNVKNSTTTSSTGGYVFEGLGAGNYTVYPAQTGVTFSPAYTAITLPSTGLTSSPNALASFTGTSTTAGYSISGYAYSYTSEGAAVGVAGVTVAITGTSLTTTTTGTGAYSFTGLAAGTYSLTATKTGDTFTANGSPVTLPTTGTSAPNGVVNFSTYLIFGTVTVNGTPASGVTVNLGGNAKTTTTTTSSTGGYVFEGLGAGSYTVSPVQTGVTFSPVYSAVTLPGTGLTASPNALASFAGTSTTSGYSISGHVYSYTTEGAPVGLADVTVAITGTSLTATTTSTGAYSFTGLAAGTYTLTATKTGDTFTVTGSPVTLPTTGTTAPNGVVNFSTYLIFGSVTINGTTATGVTVNLGGASTATTTTNSNGGYVFEGLGAGSYTVSPVQTGVTFSPVYTAVTLPSTGLTASPNAEVSFAGTSTTAGYSISGHVYSYTTEGAPVGIAGATVAITGTSLTATTTSTGAYSFTGLTAGTYTLTATKTGDTFTATGSPVTLPTTGTTAPNGVVNFSTYLIFGTVTVNGTPASGVTVNLGGNIKTSTLTSSTGGYVFEGLGAGSYTVYPVQTGVTFSPVYTAVTLPSTGLTSSPNALASFAGTSTTAGYSISGYAYSYTTEGAPVGIAGATVTITGTSLTETTTSTGAYSFTGLAAGTYTLTATKTGDTFTASGSPVTLPTTGTTAPNGVVNFSTYLIFGTVTVNGTPASGVTVNLGGNANTATTTTSSTGGYVFEGLGAGSYTVSPVQIGVTFSPAYSAVALPSTGLTSSPNALASFAGTSATSTYTVTGHAYRWTTNGTTSTSSGAAGVTIGLWSSASYQTTTTASDGSYSFTNVPAGAYIVDARHTGSTFSPAYASLQLPATGDNAPNGVVNFNTYELAGKLTNAGSPVAGATIYVWGAQVASTTTASDGTYEFPDLGAGAYFTCVKPDSAIAVTPSVVPFSLPTSNYAVSPDAYVAFTETSSGSYSVSGHAYSYTTDGTTSTKTGVAGATVGIWSPNLFETIATGSDGSYTFGDLPPGTYILSTELNGTLFSPGYQIVTLPATANGPNATLDFSVFELAGKVTANSVGVGGVTVYIWGTYTGSTVTAADGTYSFPGLPAGNYLTCAKPQTGVTYDPPVAGFSLPTSGYVVSPSAYIAIAQSGTVTTAAVANSAHAQ